MGAEGIEPSTSSLSEKRSTDELRTHERAGPLYFTPPHFVAGQTEPHALYTKTFKEVLVEPGRNFFRNFCIGHSYFFLLKFPIIKSGISFLKTAGFIFIDQL